MKKSVFCLLLAIMLMAGMQLASAAIPILQFNVSNIGDTGLFGKLPHRYLPVKGEIYWTANDTVYINMSKLVVLPEGEYAYTSNNPAHLIVGIDEQKGIVSVRPEPDFIGEEEVIIYVDGIGSTPLEDIKAAVRADLLLQAIDIGRLDAVLFDDSLYSMFSTRISGLIDARKNIEISQQVNARINENKDAILLDVGDDVDVQISFDKQDGREKPKVAIMIDASLLKFSNSIGHCGNGVRDYGESRVDCGGECLACIDDTDSSYSLVFGVIAVLLIIGMGYAVFRYIKRKPRKKKTFVPKVSLAVARRDIIEKINGLKIEIDDSNLDKILGKFSRYVRDYFKTLLHLKYNFTYYELKKELNKRKMNNSIRNGLLKLFHSISQAEYGDYKTNKQELNKLINESVELINNFEK